MTDASRQAVYWSLAAGAAGQGLMVVSGPILARFLGPAGRGQLALAIVVVTIAVQLATFGIPAALAYFIATSGGKAVHAVSQSARMWLWWSLAWSVAVALLLRWLPFGEGYAPLASAAGGLAVVSAVWNQAALAVVQGLQHFRWLSVIRVVPALLYACGALVLYLVSRAGVSAVLVLFALSQGAGALIALMAASRAAQQVPRDETYVLDGRELVRFGGLSAVASATPLDSLSPDQALVGALLPPAQLGYYAVAAAFANLPSFLLASLGYVVVPRVASTDGHGRRRLIARMLLLGAAIAVVMGVAVEIVLPFAVQLLFGPAFRPSIPIAHLLVAAGALLALRRLVGSVLQGLGRPGVVSRAELLALVVLLISVPFAVLQFQAAGAAGAMLVSAVVALVVLGRAVDKAVKTEDVT